MRIAILSDIHGNLPALEAVQADLAEQSPDQVWCGGDLGWTGAWASECIERVRATEWPTIKGNTDVWITGDPQSVDAPGEREELQRVAAAHDISDDDARWLIGLPLGHSGPGSILLVHGTPQSPFDAPMPDASPSDFAPYENAATLVVYGHVHRAFLRRLADGTLVCNTGSVGLPADGDTASYLVIDRDGPDLTIRHRRVAFDRKAAAQGARDIGGPLGQRFLESLGAP
ncbi:metallophosphoesterase family protein [soil metagenome]